MLATFVSIGIPVAGQQPELVLQVGHASTVQALAFSPDGSSLATASEGEVKLWDVASGAVLRTFTAAQLMPALGNLAFSPDGTRLAAAAGDAVVAWDLKTGQSARDLPIGANVRSIAFSPDGRRPATTSLELNKAPCGSGMRRMVEGVACSARSPCGG